jgi:DNA (cytosine-5)-methyltransferase 1
MDKVCCDTLRSNRPWPVLEGKIQDFSTEQILARANLKVGEVDLLVGGPPCQPFSKSGYWKTGDAQRLDDPRAKTLEEYMRVLEETLPTAFLIENVYGLAYKGKDEGLVYLQERLDEINARRGTKYSFEWKVINTVYYGVPQIRERVFIVGHIDGKTFIFPNPLVSPELTATDPEIMNQEYYRCAWDAIGDLDDPNADPSKSQVGGKWGKLLPSIPEGKNYLWHTNRGGGKELFGWRTRYWSFLLKLSKQLPSWTIQAQPGSAIGPFHWKNRRLSMREMSRLQTFPDDVVIGGGTSNVQRQIGNAVPSLIMEILGRSILEQFFGRKISGELKLLPKKLRPIPSNEPVFTPPANIRPAPVSARALREETLVRPSLVSQSS